MKRVNVSGEELARGTQVRVQVSKPFGGQTTQGFTVHTKELVAYFDCYGEVWVIILLE